jgi:hypothetical protein
MIILVLDGISTVLYCQYKLYLRQFYAIISVCLFLLTKREMKNFRHN